MSVATIQPQVLLDKHAQGETVDLIDVRTPIEFQEVHVGFARNVPLDELDNVEFKKETDGSNDSLLYVICRSGNRGKKACESLVSSGRENVVNVEGGMLAWNEAGLPVQRGRKIVSLERQVRIAAGSLVLLGAILAWAVHPWFIALSAFVGAGLVFAGITDTCGMGLLLARMPWNRVTVQPQSCRI